MLRPPKREYLFSDYELHEEMETRKGAISREIHSLKSDYFLNANVEDLHNYFEEKYRYEPPVLRMEEICFDQDEVEVDVSQDFNRAIFDRGQQFYIKGTLITFIIPFDGNADLFRARPSTFTTILPVGRVYGGELRLEYRNTDHDGDRIRSAFERDIHDVQQYLGFVAENVIGFNQFLPGFVRKEIQSRREKLLKDRGLAESLGFPMKRREGLPQTVSVSIARKIPVRLPSATTQPFKPEPALEMDNYEQILASISNMALVLERSPQAFVGMKEEDLRTHFLVALNGQYEGKATGETFNFEGKTDILIRVEGRNIFIAECKFWKGPEALKETIDQLLGYTSWRDTKTAILLFNRNKDLSAVLAKLPAAMTQHSNFERQLDYANETGFRFMFRQKNDTNRRVLITVLVFDIPTKSEQEESYGTI
jgi:hypothetical protein